MPNFGPIFVDFQNEAGGLCVNNFINKDVKWTFMISQSNLKPYLSNPSRICKIEAMEAVLWLIKRVYFFLTHPVLKLMHESKQYTRLISH